MGRNIVSILDYRASRSITHVKNMLERAHDDNKVSPGNWKSGEKEFRSLTVYNDGSCLLHPLTVASMVRKLKIGAIKRGMEQ